MPKRVRRKNRRTFGRRFDDICLRLLHPKTSLSKAKLAVLRKRSTEELIASLEPGKRDALKTRPDGTVLDGHHRLTVLCKRDFDVDQLPREIVPRESE